MQRIPKCMTDRARAMRREPTPAERELWKLLSRYRPPFTRQLSIEDRAVLDLACRQTMLGIELDGSQHHDQAEYDAERTLWLESLGWKIVRLWNNEVLGNPQGAAEHILQLAAERLACPLTYRPSQAGRDRKPRFR